MADKMEHIFNSLTGICNALNAIAERFEADDNRIRYLEGRLDTLKEDRELSEHIILTDVQVTSVAESVADALLNSNLHEEIKFALQEGNDGRNYYNDSNYDRVHDAAISKLRRYLNDIECEA